MMDAVHALFHLVCGQLAEHTWTPGGALLPVCQRCTGLYAGAAGALALHLTLRIRPSVRFLQMHGAFLLVMIPLGYHWVPQNTLIRTLSGALFGVGLVCFLWVLAGERMFSCRDLDRRTWRLYLAVLAWSFISVPAAAAWGGHVAWYTLTATCLVGLAGLAALALAGAMNGIRGTVV